MAQVQRRRPAKSKAAVAKQSMRDYFIMALVMIVVVGGIIAFKRWNDRIPGATVSAFSSQSTFLNGVHVNGIDLGGMTQEQGQAAVEQQIADQLGQSINVHYNGRTFSRTAAELGTTVVGLNEQIGEAWAWGHTGSEESRRKAYEYIQQGNEVAFNCTLKTDEQAVEEFVNEIAVNVNVRPVEAEIKVDASQLFDVTEHQDGVKVNEAKLQADILYALNAGTGADINLVPDAWKPESTTEIANAMQFKISEAVTNARSSNENRTRNIMRALEPFKSLAVAPGETISFNGKVGPRTTQNRFYPAQEFVDGELTDGIGGGTCQASTTLMQALVQAGFTIDERWQHSLRVSYCDPSKDSTVTSTGKIKDLKFTNNTENTMYIFASCSWTEAKVEVYGIKPPYKMKLKTRTINVIPWKGKTKVKKQNAKKAGTEVLKKDGVNGCVTEGYLAYYDWDTGEKVEDGPTLWHDEYAPVKPVYYVYE